MTFKASKKAKRNAPCPCGSGRKFKNCCVNVRDQIVKADNKRRVRYVEELKKMKDASSRRVDMLKLVREVKERSGFWGRRCPKMSAKLIRCAIEYWPTVGPSVNEYNGFGPITTPWHLSGNAFLLLKRLVKSQMIHGEMVGRRWRIFMWFALSRLMRTLIDWSLEDSMNMERLRSANMTLMLDDESE